MTSDPFPAVPPVASRLLTAEQFQRLADAPPEIEWFANLGNKTTRRAYENAIGDSMKFTAIVKPEEFRSVIRAHVIAWRGLQAGAAILSGARFRDRGAHVAGDRSWAAPHRATFGSTSAMARSDSRCRWQVCGHRRSDWRTAAIRSAGWLDPGVCRQPPEWAIKLGPNGPHGRNDSHDRWRAATLT